jgi:hypothetical protein
MAYVLDLYETQEILRSRFDFSEKHLGAIVMDAVSRQKRRDFAILRKPSCEQAERVMKRCFQSALRSRFYGVKNALLVYQCSKDKVLNAVLPGDFDDIAPGTASIDGLVKKAIIHLGVEGAMAVIGEAVVEGGLKYHREKPSGTDGRYKLFVEYNAVVNALASKLSKRGA